jgi:hypothetical protein
MTSLGSGSMRAGLRPACGVVVGGGSASLRAGLRTS